MSYVTVIFVYCDGGDECPMESEALECKAVGNGVPLAMGRAIAAAVKEAIYGEQC